MKIEIFKNKNDLGKAAAKLGANAIRKGLAKKQSIAIIVATGASQFEMLEALVNEPDINWSCVTVFHLDEYIGLPDTHPASFRQYLRERFITKLPTLKAFIEVNGSANDIPNEIKRISDLISAQTIDVCFAGIGENGHLAFNDPPADFTTQEPYLVVNLDEACRYQQLGEGWFTTLEDVPKQAISMGISQIMKSKTIILSVPDLRKANAVKACIEGSISNRHPASILQKHPDCTIFLDQDSASNLSL